MKITNKSSEMLVQPEPLPISERQPIATASSPDSGNTNVGSSPIEDNTDKTIAKVGDVTQYGLIIELVEINGVIMMRSNYPYGTWPILNILEP